MNDTLGDKIKEARITKGLKQSELAKMIGIKNTTISNWEKNVSKPDVDMVELLCGALEVSPNYFFAKKVNADNKLNVFEYEHIQKYRKLDVHGKEITNMVMDAELQRIEDIRRLEKIKSKVAYMEDYAEKKRTRRIPLYALSAGAGNGVFLDSNDYELIDITLDSMSEQATFAVRVSGDSMEPKYSTGDILLVKTQPEVEIGELGIFILNGEGFFKKYGGDHLISFNDAYSDIVFKEYDDISCKGKVLGALEED